MFLVGYPQTPEPVIPLVDWHKLTYFVLTCRKTPINQSINWPRKDERLVGLSKCMLITYSRLLRVEKVSTPGFEHVTYRSRNRHVNHLAFQNKQSSMSRTTLFRSIMRLNNWHTLILLRSTKLHLFYTMCFTEISWARNHESSAVDVAARRNSTSNAAQNALPIEIDLDWS